MCIPTNANSAQLEGPKLRCRWYQYSLRTLLISVTLFAIACSWFTVKMQQARKQREAVDALLKINCKIYYDFVFDGDWKINPQPPCLAWLRNLLGIDFFSNVNFVMSDFDMTDADMDYIKSMTKLQKLWLLDIRVTDAGLESLKELKQLRELILLGGLHSGDQITDAGWEHIKGLNQLQSLYLGLSRITDTGLECLKGLSQLQTLYIGNTQATDTGLEHLNGLKHLKSLNLTNTHITDLGMEHIKVLHQLQTLDLTGRVRTAISTKGSDTRSLADICIPSEN